MAAKTTLEKAKETAQKAWDKVPTREDVLNIPQKVWGHVPTQAELKKMFDDIYSGVKDFDPQEFLGAVFGYTLDKGSGAREAFNRLLKHDPRVAALFFDKIEGKTFDDAYEKAKKQGLKTFIWGANGKVYSTEYKGTPKEEMDLYGIVYGQTMDPAWWQKRLGDNLDPGSAYGNHPLKRFFEAVVLNRKESTKDTYMLRMGPVDYLPMDYFNIYMGRPQRYNTLGISEYTPVNKEEMNGKPLSEDQGRIIYKDNIFSADIKKYWAIFAKHLMNEENHRESRIYHPDGMGRMKMSLGHDEKGYYICYHDIWDLAPTGSNADFGKPFEIYDRIYFDPQKIDEYYRDQRLEYTKTILSYSPLSFSPLLCDKFFKLKTVRIKDDKGNYINQDEDGNVVWTEECRYDQQNRMIGCTYRDADGNILHDTEYIYNEHGAVNRIIRDSNGKIVFGSGPAYEEALKKQQETEEKNQKKAASKSEKSKTKEHGRVAMDKKSGKNYYGRRPGGIDDKMMENSANEYVKMARHTKQKHKTTA